MGPKNSKSNFDEQARVFSSKISHPKLQAAEIIQTKNPEHIFMKISHSIDRKQPFNKWKQNIKKLEENNIYSEALFFPNQLTFEDNAFCGNSGVIKAIYDFYPYNLKDEISNRKAIHQTFSENELWYILYMLCCAGCGLHSRGQILGDVRPNNVFVNNDGQVRVSNLYTFHDESTNFFKFFSTKEKTYIAPQQVIELQNGKIESNENLIKAECFSVGLTILQAINLTDLRCIYSNVNLQFKENQLKEQFKKADLSNIYSKNLLAIVEGLCEIDPNFRVSCQQIISVLKPYEQQIVQLDDFDLQIRELPQSIQQRIQNRSLLGSTARGNLSKVINLENNRKSTPEVLPFQQHRTNGKEEMFFSRSQFSRDLPPPHPQIQNSFKSMNSVQSNITFQNLRADQRDVWVKNAGLHVNTSIPSSHSVNNSSIPIVPPPQNFHLLNSSLQRGQSSIKNPNQNIYHQNMNSGDSSNIQVFQYGSKIDSYIPPVQHESIYIPTASGYSQNRPLQQPQTTTQTNNPEKPILAQYGRPATSYQRQTYHYVPQKLQENPINNDNLYKSYEDTLKDVEKKLKESRTMFPQ